MRTESRKSFGAQVFAFGVVQLILRLRGLITLPVLSRLIGAAGYGLLSPLSALAALIPSFVTLGSPTALTVFIPGKPPAEKRREFWAIAQTTFAFGLLAYAALLVFFSPIQRALLPAEATFPLFAAAMAIIPFSALQMTLYAQILNNRQGAGYAKITALASALELALLLAGAYWFGVIGVLYASMLAQLVLCALMIWIISSEDPPAPLSLKHLPDLGKYYVYGMTIFIAGFGAWAIDSSDRFIIGKFLTTDSLGVYQVAYNLCAQLSQIAAPIFSPLMPFVVAAINENQPQQARRYLEKSLKLLLFIYAPAVILFSVGAADLIAVLSTPAFAAGAALVPYVAAGVAVFQINGVFTYTLHAHRRGYLLVISLGVAAAANVALNLIFVPRYGILAAAVSTFFAYFLHFAISWYFARQSLKVGVDAAFAIKLTVAAVAALLIALLVKFAATGALPIFRFAFSAFAGGTAYLTLSYFFQLFSPAELAPVWKSAQRWLPKRSK